MPDSKKQPAATPSKAGLWLPPVIWMGLIFLFSTDIFSGSGTGGIILPVLRVLLGWALSEHSLVILHHIVRKGAHLTEYAVLGLLMYRAINYSVTRWDLKNAVLTFTLASIYAATDEFHQTFTLYREGRVQDVIIDSSGILLAMIAIWFYNNRIIGLKNQ